ncbi:MAG: hypothetical protein ABFR97_05510 [Thermodesulfobacteriota bacterium]
MENRLHAETHRRTVAKSLLWRFIGIFWTWSGAFIIILTIPKEQKNAITIATLVTAWHHSTRMVMYYLYERVWAKIKWGRSNSQHHEPELTIANKIQWTVCTSTAIVVIFWLLFSVTPQIKNNQKKAINERVQITQKANNHQQ